MKTTTLALSALVLVVGLAACKQNTPPADGLPAAAAPVADTSSPAPAPPGPAVPAVNTDVDFTVEPAVVYACEGRDRTAATVKWAVRDPSVVTVKVEIDTATNPSRQTFTVGGAAEGEAKTEEWVGAGTRFHLLDAATGKELANYEVSSLPC